MPTDKQFKDFDSNYHKIFYVTIDGSVFEIWHMIFTSQTEIEIIANNFIKHEKDCGRELRPSYKLDFRRNI